MKISRRLAESLQRFGLESAETPDQADVVVLYSCVVRQQAEDRVHGQLQALRQVKAARPQMKVVVAGCVSDIPDWRRRYPFVDLPRRVTGLEGVEALLQTLAGERDEPRPVHAVVVP